ncbi:hypothetical protein ROJ8625_01165 [Roseivivax jejudonensis]|uniref:Sulfotransferase family protein n=1 Tax=Roseivivax jejudonensis TaxID=1529041 RepID=A0A1X6YQ07_9RHOB|nr:hypothetical protein [Roseivivax jejudonensis]SLN27949.1 hypothetical protein ROJ8625_01165 [Roseivivax jejudonensis]
MNVVLHLGAHRSASTSFQCYARSVAAPLAARGVTVWDPRRTRTGLLHNVAARTARPRDVGRVRLASAAEAARGTRCLVVSDENMIGTPRACLRARRLYPDIGERMARLGAAFRPTRAVLQIRAQDSWWTSLLAYLVTRSAPPPDPVALAAIVAARRSWRDVVTDLACALPDTAIVVTPFERFADAPDALMAALTADPVPPRAAPGAFRANRAPSSAVLAADLSDAGHPAAPCLRDGRWAPIPDAAAASMREAYRDDLYWLRAGADGLARYVEDADPARAAQTATSAADRRGQDDAGDQDRLEGSG